MPQVIAVNIDFKIDAEGNFCFLEWGNGITKVGYPGNEYYQKVIQFLEKQFDKTFVINVGENLLKNHVLRDDSNKLTTKNTVYFDNVTAFLEYIKQHEYLNSEKNLIVIDNNNSPLIQTDIAGFLKKQGIKIPVLNENPLFRLSLNKKCLNELFTTTLADLGQTAKIARHIPHTLAVNPITWDTTTSETSVKQLMAVNTEYFILKMTDGNRGSGSIVVSKENLQQTLIIVSNLIRKYSKEYQKSVTRTVSQEQIRKDIDSELALKDHDCQRIATMIFEYSKQHGLYNWQPRIMVQAVVNSLPQIKEDHKAKTKLVPPTTSSKQDAYVYTGRIILCAIETGGKIQVTPLAGYWKRASKPYQKIPDSQNIISQTLTLPTTAKQDQNFIMVPINKEEQELYIEITKDYLAQLAKQQLSFLLPIFRRMCSDKSTLEHYISNQSSSDSASYLYERLNFSSNIINFDKVFYKHLTEKKVPVLAFLINLLQKQLTLFTALRITNPLMAKKFIDRQLLSEIFRNRETYQQYTPHQRCNMIAMLNHTISLIEASPIIQQHLGINYVLRIILLPVIVKLATPNLSSLNELVKSCPTKKVTFSSSRSAINAAALIAYKAKDYHKATDHWLYLLKNCPAKLSTTETVSICSNLAACFQSLEQYQLGLSFAAHAILSIKNNETDLEQNRAVKYIARWLELFILYSATQSWKPENRELCSRGRLVLNRHLHEQREYLDKILSSTDLIDGSTVATIVKNYFDIYNGLADMEKIVEDPLTAAQTAGCIVS